MSDKLAFPGWAMGQVLLPEQFLALQETLVSHMALRGRLSGLPSHGLVQLRLSEGLLETGSIRIDALTWVFESGLVLDVPGNAVVSVLDLADVKGNEASLFMHIRAEARGAAGLATYSDEPTVTREILQVELSLQDHRMPGRGSAKLAQLERRGGTWALSERYCPPLLQVGRSPFLRGQLTRTQGAIERLEQDFAGRSVDAFLGEDQLSELRKLRSSAFHVLAQLADHGIRDDQQEVTLHPYVLFCTLRDFYIELSILQGATPKPWPIRYAHDKLAECFETLYGSIHRTQSGGRTLAPRLEFKRDAEWFVTPTFPEALCKAEDVYLVAQPGRATKGTLDGVKLASPHRIEEVHTRALAGVRLSAVEHASLSHTYGRESIFYEVSTKDAEWRSAVSDQALCFRAWPELEGMQAALVWMREG